MKYSVLIPLWLALLLLAFTSHAADETVFKQEIRGNFEKIVSESKIQEPSQGAATRSPTGSKLYRETANGIVLIMTLDKVMGSGVVISSRGLVVTNWHVVNNQSLVGILFKQVIRKNMASLTEKDIFVATVLRVDPVRDLALLQIISPPPVLTAIPPGSMSNVEVGQDVFAISHPEGLLWSYTEGVVSQIYPDYTLHSEDGKVHQATYIQTQAVISHGSSGGALFDYNGRLIGILVSSLGPGLNFAIAVNEVQRFMKDTLDTPCGSTGRKGFRLP